MPSSVLSIASLLSFAVTYFAIPALYSVNNSLALPFWLTLICCVIGLAFTIAVIYLTNYGEARGLVTVRFAG